MITAKIILDSINIAGIRLTTFQLSYPQYIHPQVLTHRAFSRNASSSRAIPVRTMLEDAINNFEYPIFMANQPGMAAENELPEDNLKAAEFIWGKTFETTVLACRTLDQLGVHKQSVNRLLQPFTNINVILTATDFNNFFDLRLAHDAQQEIQELARCMKEALDNSTPCKLRYGEWHIPFILQEEEEYSLADKLITSVARCARVSYNKQNRISSPSEDGPLVHRLLKSGHWSPFEHIARNVAGCVYEKSNFRGFVQLRQIVNDVLTADIWEQYKLE